MRNNILFDLDGTLTNPGEGITRSVQHALVALGVEPPPLKELEAFIGPPLGESFREIAGFSQQQADLAVFHFRQYFREKGIFQNEMFPGMPALLDSLKQKGKTLYVATSKPEVFARQVLDYFDLTRFFDDIVGSPLDNEGSPKPEIVKTVMRKNRLAPKTAVMVGDRRHDVVGGKQNGLVTVGVLYGFGSREEFEAAGADYIARDLDQLLEILCLPDL